MNRKNLGKLGLLLTITLAFAACKKDNNEPEAKEPGESNKEQKYVRVLVSDELSTQLSFIDPFNSKITAITAKYPLANLYGTASGRYAAVLYQNQNLVEVNCLM